MSTQIVFTNNIPFLTSTGRIEQSTPTQYRLAKREGELVLQGLFHWDDGDMKGSDWKDLPTVELRAEAA